MKASSSPQLSHSLLGVVVYSLLSFTAARADTVAATYTGGSLALDTSYTDGWSFTLSSAVTVTQLGIFDLNGDGLDGSHTVGIYAAAGSTPLISTTIAAGTGATLLNGFRYQSVTPTLLAAGTYNIGAYYGPSNTDSETYFANTVAGASPVTYNTGQYQSGAALTNPTNSVSVNGYFGPNFQFTPAPEPTTCLLALTGFAAFLTKRRRGRDSNPMS